MTEEEIIAELRYRLEREAIDKKITTRLKQSGDPALMIDFIERFYLEVYSPQGTSTANQRFVADMLLEAAELANNPDLNKKRRNPIVSALGLSGKFGNFPLEHSIAIYLRYYEHQYFKKRRKKRGSVAYAIEQLLIAFPHLDDHYTDTGTIRRLYNKFDPEALDRELKSGL